MSAGNAVNLNGSKFEASSPPCGFDGNDIPSDITELLSTDAPQAIFSRLRNEFERVASKSPPTLLLDIVAEWCYHRQDATVSRI
jgi:hypothetical protein